MATWYESKSDSARTYTRNGELVRKKREAESKYPNRKIVLKDGVLIFLDTGDPVPGSSFITETVEDGVTGGWFY